MIISLILYEIDIRQGSTVEKSIVYKINWMLYLGTMYISQVINESMIVTEILTIKITRSRGNHKISAVIFIYWEVMKCEIDRWIKDFTQLTWLKGWNQQLEYHHGNSLVLQRSLTAYQQPLVTSLFSDRLYFTVISN